MVVVLVAVCVLVIEMVAGVCRQEHTSAISEDGRARMLEKMLDCAVDIACLFLTKVVPSVTVAVVVL